MKPTIMPGKREMIKTRHSNIAGIGAVKGGAGR